MAIKAYAWAWEQQDLRASSKLLLIYLAACSKGRQAVARVSTSDVVKWTGLDKKTVALSVRELEDRGLITAERSPGMKPVYTLHCGCAE